MNLKTMIMCLCLIPAISTFAQSSRIKKSRVNLLEKQNKPASKIPEILLKAYSNGEIKAYYPQALKKQVPYAQFLNHFGMAAKANRQIANGQPSWFCKKAKPLAVDDDVLSCMQYSFEIGEESYRNNVSYQQSIRMVYVKLIYSNQCTADGLEKEGPVFKIKDIRKLIEREHKIINAQNSAVSYTIGDYLALRLFRADPVKR